MGQEVAPLDLESLEAKVHQAAKLIEQLKHERDALRRSRDELETRVKTLQSAAASNEWRRRATEAEARLARHVQERTSLARRVEQMLEKIRAVEESELETSR